MRLLIALLVVGSLLAVLPAASASPGEPQCLQVYQEYNLGPVRIVRPNSCTTHVYVCDRDPGAALEAANPADCVVSLT